MKSILLVSGKGGSGKSTVAANIAYMSSYSKENVLLVEATPGFHYDEFELKLTNRKVNNFEDYTNGRCAFESAVIQDPSKHFYFMASSNSCDKAIKPHEIDLLLETAENVGFQKVVFDAPSGYDETVKNLANKADTVLIINEPNKISARNNATLSAQLISQGIENQKLIINKMEKKLAPSSGIKSLDEIIDITGVQLIGVIPEHTQEFRILFQEEPAQMAIANICKRINGQRRPLLDQFL